MHKRTTPKIFKQARELRREMTPVELKLHAHLRAHRMGGVHFRPHTAPVVGAGDMPSATASWIFARHAENLLLNWMEVSILNRSNTI